LIRKSECPQQKLAFNEHLVHLMGMLYGMIWDDILMWKIGTSHWILASTCGPTSLINEAMRVDLWGIPFGNQTWQF
jgi:hypothetical protein